MHVPLISPFLRSRII